MPFFICGPFLPLGFVILSEAKNLYFIRAFPSFGRVGLYAHTPHYVPG